MKTTIKRRFIMIVICILSTTFVLGQSKSNLEDDLDSWFADHFYDCYGCKYDNISIEKYDYSKSSEFFASGYVAFKNLLDITAKTQFMIKVKVRSNGRMAIEVATKDSFFDKWNGCEKSHDENTKYFKYTKYFIR